MMSTRALRCSATHVCCSVVVSVSMALEAQGSNGSAYHCMGVAAVSRTCHTCGFDEWVCHNLRKTPYPSCEMLLTDICTNLIMGGHIEAVVLEVKFRLGHKQVPFRSVGHTVEQIGVRVLHHS